MPTPAPAARQVNEYAHTCIYSGNFHLDLEPLLLVPCRVRRGSLLLSKTFFVDLSKMAFSIGVGELGDIWRGFILSAQLEGAVRETLSSPPSAAQMHTLSEMEDRIFRMVHLVKEFGRVDNDFGCSTLSGSAGLAKLAEMARLWTIIDRSEPSPSI